VSLEAGRTLAHCRITAAIGSGSMGEVYCATDTKLGPDVALELLPESFASNPERLARFERKARPLAPLDGAWALDPLRLVPFNYDVMPGGRFLMVEHDPAAVPTRINVIFNWFEELNRLVPPTR
jgi:serine/threonine protein kinase